MSKNVVTITHIAEDLIISPSTVSCVLRGDAKKFRIAKPTERKILEAAKRLGYIPNQSARNLRSLTSHCISVLFSDLELSWADTVLKGVESVVSKEGYGIFIAVDRRDPDVFMHEINAILQRRDEAIICHSHSVVISGVEKLRQSVPLVFVSDLPESLVAMPGLNSVLWDGSGGIEKAIKHFAAAGRKKVSFMGCRHGFISDMRRYNAFEASMKLAGLELHREMCIWMSDNIITTDVAIESLFKERKNCPDAIFAINDSIAIRVIKSLKKIGLRVPDDVAVIGVGDLPMSEFIGLTTIVEPLEELGRKAAEAAVELIKNDNKGHLQYFVDSSELAVRTSA